MSDFQEYKAAMRKHVANLLANSNVLYHTTVGGDEMWQWFIDALPEALRPEYTCNACRHFIKHFGGLVSLNGYNGAYNIWQFAAKEPFQQVNETLSAIVAAATIRDVFVPSEDQSTRQLMLGVDFNIAQIHDENNKPTGQTQRWEHLSFQLPANYKLARTATPEAVRAKYRDNKQGLMRSIMDVSTESLETVKDLIAQNSLYRGEEHLFALTEFSKIKAQVAELPADQLENFCWVMAMGNTPESVLRFRKTVIGTLAEDLTNEVPLDDAVKMFESKVAPANYKRPTALVTARMIQDAEKTVNELGVQDSLLRRMAVPEDLDITRAMFVDRSRVRNGKLGGSAFAMMADAVLVVPKQFSKVEQLSLKDFVEKVLPTAQGLEFLLENRHEPQMVSLIAPQHDEAPNIFKHNNPYSWSYNKALADGIKERVKEVGGNVIADVRATLQWNEDGQSICDLDLHAYEPGGEHLSYMSHYRGQGTNARRTLQSGNLDVDMISPSTIGIENITWTDHRKMKTGTIRVDVNKFSGGKNNGCRIQIEVLGETYEFSYNKNLTGTIHVADIINDRGTFRVVAGPNMTAGESNVTSKEFWGLKTYSFVPVSAVTYSPNYWNENWTGTGNRHVFFFLQGAKNESLVRGFFNEMLDARFDKHRKVFEILAGKLPVAPAEEELSGVGFATTGDHEFLVKVKGSFERVLRVVA